MFDQIIEWLEDASHGEKHGYSARDVQTAVAALYYHMISVDGVVRLKELERFTNVLQEQFELDDEQVHSLMRRGAKKDSESPGLFPFTTILNREFSEEKRREVVEKLGELAESDGHRHPLELELLSHIRQLLKLE